MIEDVNRYRSFLYQMLRIRQSQEKIAELYPEQEMRCPVHLCTGQEAIPVGVCHNLFPTDHVFSYHRSHGHYLAKGGNMKALFAELYGKITGCAKGRGGSMHLIDMQAGFLGSASIIAGTIPVAVGSAFSAMMQASDRVVVSFLGDAAVEEGLFHESVNFAVLHKLPVVFVCENNLYSVYSRISRRQPSREIYAWMKGYGMDSFQCEGNDVIAVFEMAQKAVEKARKGEGPTFIECLTYRWREHCGPDFDNDLGYRSMKEYQAWKERCPIRKITLWLKQNGIITDQEIGTMVREIQHEIDQAVQYAKESPFPAKDDLLKFIFAGEINHE